MTFDETFQTACMIIKLSIAVWLFSRTLPLRDHVRVRVTGVLCCVGIGAVAAIVLGFSVFPTLTDENSYIEAIFTFVGVLVVTVVAQMIIYKCPIWTSIFCCSMAYALENLSSTIERLISQAWMEFAGESYPVPLLEGLVRYWIISAIVYVIAYWLLIRRIQKTGLLQIDDPIMVIVAALAIIVNMLFDLVNKDIGGYEIPEYYVQILNWIYLFLCVYVLYSSYEIVYTRRLQMSMAALERLRASEAKQYEASRENIEAINIKCHDIKHQIRTLGDNGMQVDKKALDDLSHEVNVYDTTVRSGNDALDTILTEKSLLCEQRGITLSVIADGEVLNFMDSADLYSLFGNAVDNAIEAVSGLEDPGLRIISLDVRRVGDMVAIHVENPFTGSIEFGDDGLPLTSKGDTRNHGFGMRSMRMVVESYGGSLSVDVHDDVFCLNALIPCPE